MSRSVHSGTTPRAQRGHPRARSRGKLRARRAAHGLLYGRRSSHTKRRSHEKQDRHSRNHISCDVGIYCGNSRRPSNSQSDTMPPLPSSRALPRMSRPSLLLLISLPAQSASPSYALPTTAITPILSSTAPIVAPGSPSRPASPTTENGPRWPDSPYAQLVGPSMSTPVIGGSTLRPSPVRPAARGCV